MSFTRNKISYDNKYDVLYFTLEDSDNSYGDEIDDDIVLMKDIETNAITGITVMGFLKLYHDDIGKLSPISQYLDIDEVASKCNMIN